MSEVADPTFRTKTGTCTITPDRIILARSGARGALARTIFGNSMSRAMLLYGLCGIASLILGGWSLLSGQTVAGVCFGSVGAFYLWVVIVSRRNSATPIIERASVRSVDAHPPHPPATRGYFNVRFEEGGTVRRRIIILPGTLEGGSAEYERAVSLLRAAGLLPESSTGDGAN